MSDVLENARPYHYAVTNLDAINMWLDGEHVFSDNKVLKLTENQHKELQDLMRKGRSDITQNLQLIDMAAAEEVARKHMAQHRPHAAQGAHNTASTPGGGNDLQKVTPIVVPDANPTQPGHTQTLAEKIAAQRAGKVAPQAQELTTPLTPADHNNAGPILDANQEARKVLNAPAPAPTPANPEESAAFHPEDNDAAAAALAASQKK